MDIYQKKKLKNVLLLIIFIIGIGLQIFGHRTEGIKGLMIQFISLVVLLTILYIYNKQYENLTVISIILIVLIILTILIYFNV